MGKILEDGFLTAQELADKIRRPVGTLYNWRSRGEGPPSLRVGGRVMYRARAVEAWLCDQEAASCRGDDISFSAG